jgi:hypothetical protein
MQKTFFLLPRAIIICSFTSRIFLITLFILPLISLQAQTGARGNVIKQKKYKQITTQNNSFRQLSYVIIPSSDNTYGYDILSDNKKVIHQPSKPGLPGNTGFDKKEDAEKVAKLVIYKLSHNIMPPTVEKRELDSLKIKLNG